MLSLRITWECCEIYVMHYLFEPEKLIRFPLDLSVDRLEAGIQEFPMISSW
jgi:hypothetical protein